MPAPSLPTDKHDRAATWLDAQIHQDPSLKPIAEELYAGSWTPFMAFISRLLDTKELQSPTSTSMRGPGGCRLPGRRRPAGGPAAKEVS